MRLKSLGLLALVLVALVSSACATFRNNNGSVNVQGILSDARWGLTAACDVQWVPADACTIGLDALTTAGVIAENNPANSGRAVRQSLVDVEGLLPADSRLRPYLDAAIVLLPS